MIVFNPKLLHHKEGHNCSNKPIGRIRQGTGRALIGCSHLEQPIGAFRANVATWP